MIAIRCAVSAAVLMLAGLAALASGHDPNLAPIEAVGNPTGLTGIAFRGPAGTPIENVVCDPIPDALRPMYADPGTGHIGHINGVTDMSGVSNFIEVNSIDLWHLEDNTYSNPRSLEGPHPVTDSTYSVMLGSDGFFRGKMFASVPDGPGPEIEITDVHSMRTYCVYGAIDHDGPYLFIDSAQRDGLTSSSVTNLDLSDFYADLFHDQYPTDPDVRLDYIFLVASTYRDPPLRVDFSYTHLDAPLNYDLAPGVDFQDESVLPRGASAIPSTTYDWDFGDGGTYTGVGGSFRTPNHQYADDGTYPVCLRVTVSSGETARTCHDVTVNNRPPTPDFPCPTLSGTLALFSDASSDVDGTPVRWDWDLGDGDGEVGAAFSHQYPRDDYYTIQLTVKDDDGATATTSKVCWALGPPNRAPHLDHMDRYVVPVGSTVTFVVTGWDPDADPLTFSAISLPTGATFDPVTHTFTLRSSTMGVFEGIRFRVQDPKGLYDEGQTMVTFFEGASDFDGDGIQDTSDLCPGTADRTQRDADHDGEGDACDVTPPAPSEPADVTVSSRGATASDQDRDGVADGVDDCPAVPNRDQADQDRDGQGDLCDVDLDGDGVPNHGIAGAILDDCPTVADPGQEDANGDGLGDACASGLAARTAPASQPAPAPPARLGDADLSAASGSSASWTAPAAIGAGAFLLVGGLAAAFLAWTRRRDRA